MKVIEIEGGRELTGQIRISGAKNATVALIPAAILTDEEATICNVPEITDTDALCDILKELKVDVKRASESMIINPGKMKNKVIEELIDSMVDESSELISIYYGQDVTEEEADNFKARVLEKFDSCDVELQYGGQPIYFYILSAE